jgi:hypothetical protein
LWIYNKQQDQLSQFHKVNFSRFGFLGKIKKSISPFPRIENVGKIAKLSFLRN